jgi:hypothetical protein
MPTKTKFFFPKKNVKISRESKSGCCVYQDISCYCFFCLGETFGLPARPVYVPRISVGSPHPSPSVLVSNGTSLHWENMFHEGLTACHLRHYPARSGGSTPRNPRASQAFSKGQRVPNLFNFKATERKGS